VWSPRVTRQAQLRSAFHLGSLISCPPQGLPSGGLNQTAANDAPSQDAPCANRQHHARHHRPFEAADEEEQEDEPGEKEEEEEDEDEDEEVTPVKNKRAKPTKTALQKRAPVKRPREGSKVAMAVRELIRLDEEDSDDEETSRVLDKLEAKRHQLMWQGPDGIAYPAHPATTPEMKWAYAHAWVGSPVAEWVSEFRNYVRYTQSVHRMEFSRSGHQMVAHLENLFVPWLGTTTASTKTQRATAVGQSILEAILLQAIFARHGQEGVIECCEALAEARGKGKVVLSSLIKTIKAKNPDYTANTFEKKRDTSEKKVHFKKWEKRDSRDSRDNTKKGRDFRKKRQ
jgi:hypothetical protein